MNLKTSFFNKSVIRSDFKRLWWVSVIDALMIFISFTFIYINRIKSLVNYLPETSGYIDSEIFRVGEGSIVFACMIPVALAALLFAYLNSSKSASCMHGLPVKRGTFFFSHMFSGIVLLTIPVIVNVLIFLLYRFDADIAASFRISHIFIWAGIYMIYTLLTFSAAAAVSMLAGNSISAIVMTYVIAILPACIEFFIYYFLGQQIYGYSGEVNEYVTMWLYVTPHDLYIKPMNIVKYLCFAIAFVAAAYWLYKTRNLENNSEVVAFPKLRPVFIYGAAAAFGAMGYSYFNEMWNTSNIFMLIPFGVIGIFAAHMLVQKTLNLRGGIKPAVIFCIGVCILNILFSVDITGYEKRIPATETIESAVFDNYANNMVHYSYTSSGREVKYENKREELTSLQDIDNVKQLHESCIKERRKLEDTESGFRFEITYNLKNGKKMRRCYVADYELDKALLKPIIETDAVRHNYFPILKDDGRKMEYAEIYNNETGMVLGQYRDENVLGRIYEALRYDTAHTTYENFADRSGEISCVNIDFKVPAKYEDGTDVAFRDLPIQSETYYIRKDYAKTRELLQSLNINPDVKK